MERKYVAAGTATLEPELPATVSLESLNDARLRVKEPIAVAVFATEGLIVAEAEELSECGDGVNQAAAIADLQYAIADLYFTLEKDKDRLGPGLQKVWETLQVKIEKV